MERKLVVSTETPAHTTPSPGARPLLLFDLGKTFSPCLGSFDSQGILTATSFWSASTFKCDDLVIHITPLHPAQPSSSVDPSEQKHATCRYNNLLRQHRHSHAAILDFRNRLYGHESTSSQLRIDDDLDEAPAALSPSKSAQAFLPTLRSTLAPRPSESPLKLSSPPSEDSKPFESCGPGHNLHHLQVVATLWSAPGVKLSDIIRFSPDTVAEDVERRLILLQIVSALTHAHNVGVVHGDLTPENVHLDWGIGLEVAGWLPGLRLHQVVESPRCMSSPANQAQGSELQHHAPVDTPIYSPCRNTEPSAGTSQQQSHMHPSWPPAAPPIPMQAAHCVPAEGIEAAVQSWRTGQLSNYDYIMQLNCMAGRRWGDMRFHPFVPWPLDFSCHPEKGIRQISREECEAPLEGWRDLRWSKYVMLKGQEQLDRSYEHDRHHVPDVMLPELSYCLYLARRLPLPVLQRKVRNPVIPEEYAVDMKQLYDRTPDESIPEFFSDSKVFESIHEAIPDLSVPSWAASAEDFIDLHRQALESERVSLQLHHWIDLAFGYKLSGDAAVAAKNVHLTRTADPRLVHDVGVTQLFTSPHPQRLPRHLRDRRAPPSSSGTDSIAARQGLFGSSAGALWPASLPRRVSMPLGLENGSIRHEPRIDGAANGHAHSPHALGPEASATDELARMPTEHLLAQLRALEENGTLPPTLLAAPPSQAPGPVCEHSRGAETLLPTHRQPEPETPQNDELVGPSTCGEMAPEHPAAHAQPSLWVTIGDTAYRCITGPLSGDVPMGDTLALPKSPAQQGRTLLNATSTASTADVQPLDTPFHRFHEVPMQQGSQANLERSRLLPASSTWRELANNSKPGPTQRCTGVGCSAACIDVVGIARLASQLYARSVYLDGWPYVDCDDWTRNPLPRQVLAFVRQCLDSCTDAGTGEDELDCDLPPRTPSPRPADASTLLKSHFFTPDVWAAFNFLQPVLVDYKAAVSRMTGLQDPECPHPPAHRSNTNCTAQAARMQAHLGGDGAAARVADNAETGTHATAAAGGDFDELRLVGPISVTTRACTLLASVACHLHSGKYDPDLSKPSNPAARAIAKMACRVLLRAFPAPEDAPRLRVVADYFLVQSPERREGQELFRSRSEPLEALPYSRSIAADHMGGDECGGGVAAAFAVYAHRVWVWVLGVSGPEFAAQWLLPTWVDCMAACQGSTDNVPVAWRAALAAVLLAEDVHELLLQVVGLEACTDRVIPVVLACVTRGSQRAPSSAPSASAQPAMAASAVSLLPSMCKALLLPAAHRFVIQPLLRSIRSGPHVVLALVEVAAVLASHVVCQLLVCPLVRLLSSPFLPHPARSSAPLPARSSPVAAYQALALDVLTILDGLLSMLEAAQVLKAFLLPMAPGPSPPLQGSPPSPLVSLILGPLSSGSAGKEAGEHLSPQIRNRVASLLVHACRMAGGMSIVVEHLLPQVLPLLTCPTAARAAYGSSKESDGDVEGGYWDLIHILYPHIVEVAGAEAVHGVLVEQWQELEQQLLRRCGWAAESHNTPVASNLSLRHNLQLSLLEKGISRLSFGKGRRAAAAIGSEQMKDSLEGTALMLGGIGWHTPVKGRELSRCTSEQERLAAPLDDSAGAAGASEAFPTRHTPTLPSSNAAAAGASDATPPWSFLSLHDVVAPGSELAWPQLLVAGPAGAGAASQAPWQLKGSAIHRWVAHRERVHVAAACPHERLLLTAGRGSSAKDSAEVARCWDLRTLTARTQYTGHSRAIVSVAFVGSRPLRVASVDVSGALHFWNPLTGASIAKFDGAAPPGSSGNGELDADGLSWARQATAEREATWAHLQSYNEAASLKHHTCVVAVCQLGQAVAADGAVSGASDGSLQLWNTSPASCISSMQVFGDGGESTGTAGSSAVACLWATPGQGGQGATSGEHGTDRSGSVLIAGSGGGQIALIDCRSGLLCALWQAHADPVQCVALHGKLLLSCAGGTSVKVWNVEANMRGFDLDCQTRQRQGTSSLVTAAPLLQAEVRSGRLEPLCGFQSYCGHLLMWTPSALMLAASIADPQEVSTVRIVDRQLATPVASISQVILLPVSRLLLAAGDDGQIRICL